MVLGPVARCLAAGVEALAALELCGEDTGWVLLPRSRSVRSKGRGFYLIRINASGVF